MAVDFEWSETEEPHASRRKKILAAHPEIRSLFGPNHSALPKTLFVVFLQVATAYYLRNSSWLSIVLTSYFLGAFCNQNLFLAIHELSHNLAFSEPIHNRLLALIANLPVGVPMAITFQKYHLDHHMYQGVEGLDVDLPTQSEGVLFKTPLSKLVWVILQLFFYAFRPLITNPKPPCLWELANALLQISFDVILVRFAGWKSIIYLLLSTFVGGGLHPMAGHFVAEHYVVNPGQETYSYYGPLNRLAWNVGYHNEHHDFPRIPGCRLHKVREIAPEFYEGLKSHTSWTMVIYNYIMDPEVGPFNRIKRRKPNKLDESLKKR